MSLTVAVQMDHIASINITGDSTFALMLSAQKRGHKLFHYNAEALNYSNGRVWAKAEPVTPAVAAEAKAAASILPSSPMSKTPARSE